MKNFLFVLVVFSCHVLAAKVGATSLAGPVISESHYIVIQYSAIEAKAAEKAIGYLPKRHLTPEGSTQVWVAINSKSKDAERFASFAKEAFVVSHSSFVSAVGYCKSNPTTDYNTRPFCAPDFLKLAEVIHD